jgi:hypothetical protein
MGVELACLSHLLSLPFAFVTFDRVGSGIFLLACFRRRRRRRVSEMGAPLGTLRRKYWSLYGWVLWWFEAFYQGEFLGNLWE